MGTSPQHKSADTYTYTYARIFKDVQYAHTHMYATFRSEEATMGISPQHKRAKSAAMERVHKKAAGAVSKNIASEVAGMSERKKKAFQRALNSYL